MTTSKVKHFQEWLIQFKMNNAGKRAAEAGKKLRNVAEKFAQLNEEIND